MDYRTLLAFYLACVEEEDRRSKRVKADCRNKQYITPAMDAGSLFRETESLSWGVSDAHRRFFQHFAAEIEGPRYLYGYPVWRDKQGFLMPLFMAEVTVDLDDEGKALMRIVHPSSIQVNLHLFIASHSSLQEQLGLREELESSEFGTFDARLQQALERRGERSSSLEDIVTPPGSEGWKNRSLVFRDVGGVFTHQLRAELAELTNRNLAKEGAGTALEALFRYDVQDTHFENGAELIEVVPLNREQRRAARAALAQPMTVITGPPGTGKSQVVIDLLASMEAAGQRVLFASKNNRAVDVVRERTAAILGSDDWTLRLGSKDKIDEERKTRIEQAMNLCSGLVTPIADEGARFAECVGRRETVEEEVICAASNMHKYGQALDSFRKSIACLPTVWQEWWDEEAPSDWPKAMHDETIRKYLDDVRAVARKEWPGLRLWFLRLLNGPRLRYKYQNEFDRLSAGMLSVVPEWSSRSCGDWDTLVARYELLHQLCLCRDMNAEIKRRLSGLDRLQVIGQYKEELEECQNAIEQCARNTCRARIRSRTLHAGQRLPTLLKRYFELTERAANPRQEIAPQVRLDFSRAATALLRVTPAVIVTSLAARRSLPCERQIFDYVIIDEASQCDIASALPLLLRGRRLVVIGDPQQLRHVSSIDKRKEEELAHTLDADALLARYSYCQKSLFDCAAETYEEGGHEPFFLAEHYRSHREIIEFSSRTYYRPRYKNSLIVRTTMDEMEGAPVLWHDVPSETDRPKGSLHNEREAVRVAELTREIVASGSLRDGWTMGIVTPYKRQRSRIESLLRDNGSLDRLGPRLRVGVVHTFQGSEADIVIFSPVVAQGTDPDAAEWISNEEGLLNVALTRARRILHIVGDKGYCAQVRGNLGRLAAFVDDLRDREHRVPEETEPRRIIRQMLAELQVCYEEEWPEGNYHLDFLVVGLSGAPYDIEVDGRQHYFSAEALLEDEARDAYLSARGYRVIRFRGVTVERYPESVRMVLSRLA